MALHSLYCADVPIRNCSLTHHIAITKSTCSSGYQKASFPSHSKHVPILSYSLEVCPLNKTDILSLMKLFFTFNTDIMKDCCNISYLSYLEN